MLISLIQIPRPTHAVIHQPPNILDNIVSTWTYDLHGRVLSETVMGYKTSYTYNLANLPVSVTYPNGSDGSQGETVAHEYNERMLLYSVIGDNTYVSSTDYDSAGRMELRTFGNDRQTKYTYYPWDQQGGRLRFLRSGTETQSAFLQNLTYTYDPAGNITGLTDTNAAETQSYEYDALNRLTRWTLNSDTPEDYTYLPSGNLRVKGDITLLYQTQSASGCQNAASGHSIPHATSGAGGNTYSYDCNGNQITRVIGSDTYDLIYNAENQLVKVKKNGGLIAQFFYDGDGRRVKSVMSGVTTLFVGAHYEVTGSEVTKYYFAGSSRIAMRKYTVPSSMEVEYLLGDHLGSTSITTDQEGTKVSEIRYKPWGEIRSSWTLAQSTTPAYSLTDYTFTGQFSYMDDPFTTAVTEGFGLMFYVSRFYDPAIGRFTSADSIVPGGAQGLDRYAYVNNSPTRFTDPSGHKACGSIDDNGNCDDTEEKVLKLLDYVDNHILNNRKDGLKGKYKDDVLEAMIKVVKQAAYIFGNDWNTFLDATTYVFTGYYGHGSEAMAAAGFPGLFTDGFDGYFDGASGFHDNFVDESNQVRHFWAAFATAANPYGDTPLGEASAHFGNWVHDYVEDQFYMKDATVIDYELSLTGIDIASQVGNEIKTPHDLIGVLSYRLGEDGPGYIGPPLYHGLWNSPYK